MVAFRPLVSRCCFISFISYAWLLLAGNVSGSEQQQEQGQNQLNLFGIGLHKELRKPIYVGLLFAPSNIKDLDRLQDPNVPKRMTLKFVTRYSSRQMARMWKQRITLNNEKKFWQPLTREVLALANLFYQPMQAGDEVELVYQPLSGTYIYLNKTLFLKVEKANFFIILLNTWIGEIPATEEFKSGITGNNDPSTTQELIQQYDKVAMQVGRFDQNRPGPNKVALAGGSANSRVTTPNPSKPKRSNLTSKPTAKPVIKPIANPTTKSAIKQTSENTKKNSLPSKKITNEKPTKTPNKKLSKPISKTSSAQKKTLGTRNKNTSDGKNAGKPANRSAKLPAQKSANRKNMANQTNEVEKVARLDTKNPALTGSPIDVDLMSGSYAKELIGQIIALQTYPVRAMVDRAEGNAIVKVVIDKEGDLVSSDLVQRTRNKLLNRTVLEMVRRAAPFPPIPEGFGLEEFEFNVPVKFVLVDRKKRKRSKLKRKKKRLSP